LVEKQFSLSEIGLVTLGRTRKKYTGKTSPEGEKLLKGVTDRQRLQRPKRPIELRHKKIKDEWKKKKGAARCSQRSCACRAVLRSLERSGQKILGTILGPWGAKDGRKRKRGSRKTWLQEGVRHE